MKSNLPYGIPDRPLMKANGEKIWLSKLLAEEKKKHEILVNTILETKNKEMAQERKRIVENLRMSKRSEDPTYWDNDLENLARAEGYNQAVEELNKKLNSLQGKEER